MGRIFVEQEEKLTKGTIAREILRTLIERPVQLPKYETKSIAEALIPYLEAHGIGRKRKNSIRVALDRLRRQKFVNLSPHRGQIRIEITEKGAERLHQYTYEKLALKTESRWDKMWRMVTFDIPEEKKAARDNFSRKLKKLGFCQLQRSIFVHYAPCADEVRFMERHLGIEGTTLYAEIINFGAKNDELKKYFKLKRIISIN